VIVETHGPIPDNVRVTTPFIEHGDLVMPEYEVLYEYGPMPSDPASLSFFFTALACLWLTMFSRAFPGYRVYFLQFRDGYFAQSFVDLIVFGIPSPVGVKLEVIAAAIVILIAWFETGLDSSYMVKIFCVRFVIVSIVGFIFFPYYSYIRWLLFMDVPLAIISGNFSPLSQESLRRIDRRIDLIMVRWELGLPFF